MIKITLLALIAIKALSQDALIDLIQEAPQINAYLLQLEKRGILCSDELMEFYHFVEHDSSNDFQLIYSCNDNKEAFFSGEFSEGGKVKINEFHLVEVINDNQ